MKKRGEMKNFALSFVVSGLAGFYAFVALARRREQGRERQHVVGSRPSHPAG